VQYKIFLLNKLRWEQEDKSNGPYCVKCAPHQFHSKNSVIPYATSFQFSCPTNQPTIYVTNIHFILLLHPHIPCIHTVHIIFIISFNTLLYSNERCAAKQSLYSCHKNQLQFWGGPYSILVNIWIGFNLL
jgi:hypothetical protein